MARAPTLRGGAVAGPDGGAPGGWAIMAALVLAEILSSFEGSMIYAALATFYSTFRDPVGVGWMITGFMLVASISAAICGRLGDMFGRRRVLLVMMALAAAGSLVSATARNLEWIVLGRSIQGAAGAILPLCYGLVREHFPATRVAINIGIISATASAGGLIGVILGGVIVDHASWRYIFVLSAGLALAAIAGVAILVPASKAAGGEPVDWLGAGLFCSGMALALYALGIGEKTGWGSTAQIGYAATGLALLAAWVAWELRAPHPMIDVRLLIDRQIGLTLVTFFIGAVGALNISQIVMAMLQQPLATAAGLGISATASGLVHAPGSIVGVLVSPAVGWFAARRGARGGMILAMAVFSIAWIGLFFAHHNVLVLTAWMTLNGVGIGALMAAAPNLIVEVAPAHRTSESTGLAQIVRKIGMACGAQAVAVTLASSTIAVGGGIYPDAEAYSLTFGWIALLNLVGLGLSVWLPRRAPHTQAARPVIA